MLRKNIRNTETCNNTTTKKNATLINIKQSNQTATIPISA